MIHCETISRSSMQQEHDAYVELCRHLEHAPDTQLLSDYTATLVYALTGQRRQDALDLLKGQLYSRRMPAIRAESWYTDCGARLQEDPQGFVQHAREQFVREGLAAEERQQNENRAAKDARRPRILPASAFAPERAEYLLRPYLPRGMVSILGGVSGAGKTSLALDIAAALSAGRSLPFAADETPPETPAKHCTIFYLTAENDPNKVLRPRAEQMGADLEHIYFQSGASLCMGDQELFSLCRFYHPDLVIFDPIQSYLGQGVQMNRAEQVRPLLDNLSALAKELDMAVLLISHMSKPGPGICSALDRLLGSSDFRNAARSILIVGCDPDHPDTRVFAHAKNSLGIPGDSQGYHILQDGTLAYDGPVELTADRIIQQTGDVAMPRARQANTLRLAVESLEQLLSFVGWVEYTEVLRLCTRYGFSERTMRRARDTLQLNTLMLGQVPNRRTFWYRSDLDAEAVRIDIENQNQQLPLS